MTLDLGRVDSSGTVRWSGGKAAIGRVPVMSASGEPLAPCRLAKARKLLEAGKAVKRRSENGAFYVQLKFDPSGTIVHPPTASDEFKGSSDATRDGGLAIGVDSSYLARLRERAKRRNVWFSALCRGERDILDLTIRCVDRPKSPKLIDILARIIVKIKRALMSPVFHLMEEIGRPLAKKLSRIAKGWGNEAAGKWVEDESFVKYLTIVDMYNIPGFRLSDMLSIRA